jgi:hypothetical protein
MRSTLMLIALERSRKLFSMSLFSASLPKISYITVLMAFMIISFLIMCCSIVINLWVAALDNSGRKAEGDRVDRLCRIFFPLAYVLLTVSIGSYVYRMG